MTQPARILVVDDDQHIREVIAFALTRDGHRVDEVGDGRAALQLVTGANARRFDVLIVDVLMPELDGLTLCRTIRLGSTVPIIFVSSRSEEIDRVVGLELGGDDYIVKPFSPRELVARVNALLRRVRDAGPQTGRPWLGGAASAAQEKKHPVLRFGELELDVERHDIRVGGAPVSMTATEFAVLRVLLESSGKVFGRAELIKRAYPHENHITERTIDTHIRRIRRKLRPFAVSPIETVHGIGYRAATPPAS